MKILLKFIYIFSILTVFLAYLIECSLYPRESETRETKLLDGIWNFRISPIGGDPEIGFKKWYSSRLDLTGEVIPIPVPSSFNDITQSREIRDYIGWVWYDKQFYIPANWQTPTQPSTIKLRFGSVNYEGVVYLNALNVCNHTGGHLPFECDVTALLNFGNENIITVAINNNLTFEQIPQGKVDIATDIDGKIYYNTRPKFDFFNYAGIHRSVFLYRVPNVYISDITVVTNITDNNNSAGVINYSIEISSNKSNGGSVGVKCDVEVFDKLGNKVVVVKQNVTELSGSIVIANAQLWWPFTMDKVYGYQYTARFSLFNDSQLLDTYYLKVGIRTVSVTKTSFLINGKPFYFRGFGKHEDSDIRGRGLDYALIIKDINLIKWIGANSFRTTHYPYSDELMDEADSHGIVVIDESPAVGMVSFDEILLRKHNQAITELISRDKNRPSVVMWSLSNEPSSDLATADDYFRQVSSHARSLDSTRPMTAVTYQSYDIDKMTKYLDVILLNKYYGWYEDQDRTDTIEKKLINVTDQWFQFHQKPLLLSEFGCDGIPGLHSDPELSFSEDYQTKLLKAYHKAFDKLIATKQYFIGEHIWTFADFMTKQTQFRVVGSKKGIFTRERQPKPAARVVRCRYWKLADIKTPDSNGFDDLC